MNRNSSARRARCRELISLFVLPLLFVCAGLASLGAEVPDYTIEQNGYFAAEHGTISIHGEQLHVYSRLPKVLTERGEFELVPDDDELRPRWKGEAYYHEIYELKDRKWKRTARTFSESHGQSWSGHTCDILNQLDLSARFPQVANALDGPPKPLIKVVVRVTAEQEVHVIGTSTPSFALAIYSDTPAKQIRYALKAGLLKPEKDTWRILKALNLGEYGYFCGTRILKVRLPDGTSGWNLLVYVDEPAGSSNYMAVYSYLVTRR